ncbi:TetR/AcrR family transcriptional regulator [Luminiphilus sp.]|nr:TetR/AcrR family transcriptional regulator [Luminiphilus sp.]
MPASRPEAPNTSRQRLEARESTILDAAEQVFTRAGFDGAKVATIAQTAAVAEGTVYLYYRNKQDLLAGVVGRFWARLTLGAEEAITSEASAVTQLEQLGRYHLNSILQQFEVVSLTYRARPQQEQDLDQVREYVRVFDRIMQRGVDRGELPKDTPISQLRDVFFGTLEFSARTLKLRERSYDHSVVTNLLSIMVGSTDGAADKLKDKDKEPRNQDLMNTLKSIQKQLKTLGD